jgi:L-rhamnose mutarotase
MPIKRIGQVIGIKPEEIEEYERLHAQAWPSIIKIIKQANISNYSIFRYENLLFAYLEYTGDD